MGGGQYSRASLTEDQFREIHGKKLLHMLSISTMSNKFGPDDIVAAAKLTHSGLDPSCQQLLVGEKEFLICDSYQALNSQHSKNYLELCLNHRKDNDVKGALSVIQDVLDEGHSAGLKWTGQADSSDEELLRGAAFKYIKKEFGVNVVFSRDIEQQDDFQQHFLDVLKNYCDDSNFHAKVQKSAHEFFVRELSRDVQSILDDKGINENSVLREKLNKFLSDISAIKNGKKPKTAEALIRQLDDDGVEKLASFFADNRQDYNHKHQYANMQLGVMLECAYREHYAAKSFFASLYPGKALAAFDGALRWFQFTAERNTIPSDGTAPLGELQALAQNKANQSYAYRLPVVKEGDQPDWAFSFGGYKEKLAALFQGRRRSNSPTRSFDRNQKKWEDFVKLYGSYKGASLLVGFDLLPYAEIDVSERQEIVNAALDLPELSNGARAGFFRQFLAVFRKKMTIEEKKVIGGLIEMYDALNARETVNKVYDGLPDDKSSDSSDELAGSPGSTSYMMNVLGAPLSPPSSPESRRLSDNISPPPSNESMAEAEVPPTEPFGKSTFTPGS